VVVDADKKAGKLTFQVSKRVAEPLAEKAPVKAKK
jgi:hypothetical protein